MRLLMFKSQVTQNGISFEPQPGDPAKYLVFEDIHKFLQYSKEVLRDAQPAYDLIEDTLGYRMFRLPQAKDYKDIYSDQCSIRKSNGESGEKWYEKTRDFKNLFIYCLNFNRMSRAVGEALDNPRIPLIAISSRWEVSEYELEQLLNWYHQTGKQKYGEKVADPFWWGQRIEEALRYKKLEFEFVHQVNKKLATPSFSYLVDFYESRESLIQDLMREAWRAVLDTSHKEELDTIRLGKTYINTVIHHVAQHYTKHHGKQVYNKDNDTHETVEFSLLSDPDMDESKHVFLAHEVSEFHEIEVLHALQKILNDAEMALVRVLLGDTKNEEFEVYAKKLPSRRIAAFNFFQVDAESLRDKFGYLFPC